MGFRRADGQLVPTFPDMYRKMKEVVFFSFFFFLLQLNENERGYF